MSVEAGNPAPIRSISLAGLVRLCRWYYALPLGFTLGLTVVYALDACMSGEWAGTIAASVALSLVVAAGYVFNDILDRRTDRINAPHRPLACGSVSAELAGVWAACLAASGLAVAIAACRPAFAAGLAVVAVGLAI
jgi:4-hydroxybenzoate polyprenyltransferase